MTRLFVFPPRDPIVEQPPRRPKPAPCEPANDNRAMVASDPLLERIRALTCHLRALKRRKLLAVLEGGAA